MQKLWSEVDNYLIEQLLPADPVLEKILENNQREGLPAIDVAANQGQLLALFVQMTGARRVLEIGTLGGYSTVWMARELPDDGKLITLEFSPHHAQVARKNLQLAGVADKVNVIEGPALDSLAVFEPNTFFDLIFIDADKPNNPHYLEWALKFSRPGTLIIGDNVVREGEVTHPESKDKSVQGVRKFIELMGNNPRLTCTALQTVGLKGWDGFTLAWVKH
ncbi:O-methyltransferase [Scandinavium goeteborgense]|uniref:O-methyltransferase n=1 Tax=Scandinavium goeteborgense TaxID=1851514 RepID=UPI0021669528|nr:O-methyltransferase [Scandinavium goeteborgense]MCS2154077.1 O-methyltransferase [Scandinavium goeteborgense]